MTREEIISELDGEISRLEQVRELLQKSTSERFAGAAVVARPGASANGNARRELSPEARKRIALAQKKRWAKQRRDTAAS